MLKNEERAFQMLNDRLKEKGLTLDIICVGGYVLARHGVRTTQDIDAFYRTTPEIEKMIREVGEELGINPTDEMWLNNSVESMNAAPKVDICEDVYTFSNLSVKTVPALYIAGMKLKVGRGKDISDVAEIIKLSAEKEPSVFVENLEKLGVSGIDGSLILEAFGQAYGMDWLARYYEDHEEEILSMF